MKIVNPIYGEFEVPELVLIELMDSPSVRRLKNIQQYGIPPQYYKHKGFTRYAHSIGVFLLLRRLGAPLEEQVSGLLHDVSHTAFSHVVDHAIGNASKEDLQDKRHTDTVLKSELKQILERHNFDPHRITNHKHFPLLERENPDLCADRVDYALQEITVRLGKKDVDYFLDHLRVVDNQIGFSSFESASRFARAFLYLYQSHWADPEASLRYTIFGKMLRIALQNGIISLSDFDADDTFVMEKLISSQNTQINEILDTLTRDLEFEVVHDNPDIVLRKKFRAVDPPYWDEGVIHRVRDQDSIYNEEYKKEEQRAKEGIKIQLKKDR